MEETNEMTWQELSSEAKSSEMDGKYLTFFVDGQLFGVSIADVVQIVGMQEITQIPEFPHFAKGIINLRGSIIPLIDIRLRLGKTEKEYDESTCIIVTQIKDMLAGFIVDAVDAVTNIDADGICPPPRLSGDLAESFLIGVAQHEGGLVLLIDAVKILPEEYMESMQSVIN